MSTGIEWTDETWNPTTGCDKVSPGCDNCYALTQAARLKAMGSKAYQRDGDPRTSGPGFAIQWHEDRLDQPLRWTRPRRIFVNSMSDLFHPKVPDDFIARVFAVMALAEQHTFQVLTKRPKRMRALLNSATWRHTALRHGHDLAGDQQGWLRAGRVLGPGGVPNVWLGTSVEDQQRADERIPPLLDTPAAVRFLSCEPLLGPVDLTYNRFCRIMGWGPPSVPPFAEGHLQRQASWLLGLPSEHRNRINWVIVGGESGPGARPMHPVWARTLRDQCVEAGVPFFFKQWGAWEPGPDPDGGWHGMSRVGKHAAGRTLDGRTWDEYPREVPADG